ncbi:hypothetical protein O0B21_06815 [Staphylococcus pseudintermedius]|nr:hypothetical protein [Staphylococcus pseudintermedius]MDK3702927.1 hypothetical protein [Staphylococcus pseudintermedius]
MDQKSNIMYAISKGDMFLRPVDGPDGALTSTEIYRYDGDHFIIHDRAQRIIERSVDITVNRTQEEKHKLNVSPISLTRHPYCSLQFIKPTFSPLTRIGFLKIVG